MPTLRITQRTEPEGKYRVEIALEGDGLPRQTATATFPFEMTAQDHEDLRWYLEDYLQYPFDPAPTIAARIEDRMAAIGRELFEKVFQSDEQSRRLWAKVYENLSNIRVEVVTGVREAAAIPWELLRDPHTDTVLTQRAQAFVRTYEQPVETPQVVHVESGPIRILLVICRPKQADDVPFRSVASRLVKALTTDTRAVYQLDVLRPPTFEHLASTLRDAKRAGNPYHVVHFDGHGMYAELSADEVAKGTGATEWLKKLIPLMLSGPREGPHGYLLFENPVADENLQLVDGETVGKLLKETDVPILVLNACRSAHAEPPQQPQTAESSTEVQAQVQAFGSLAQEVINKGVTGVVAMRYNVYVVTAAQFVGDLYTALLKGASLGEAVTLGRKQLILKPERTIAYAPRPLQDWCVPVVYEALPTTLFPIREDDQPLKITVDAPGASTEAGTLDTKLPKPPDAGFFGRDETLLALDRAFDTQSVVLLHAYAGSGKTATAAEFARWYALTGGFGNQAYAVLFTSFEQYTPLPRVLDRIEEVFGKALEQSGVNWLALEEARRREVALQVLKQIPVLWIWDNVEPVAGFPKGTESAWTKDEQRELVDFLRDARDTKAKFLLTSRRDEKDWLGDELPRRIQVPPMPMQERVQLAKALAERQGRKLGEVDDWRPLLRFTDGNPLTITVLVGQALRDGLKTGKEIEAFVDKLRRGEAAFTDEADQGRTRSLGASLAYGFENAFTEPERKQLACLHFFQGFVDVGVLRMMGAPEFDWCVPELRGLTRETGIALLDRAAEIGLLTAHGDGYYTIHPALPWFFKSLFDQKQCDDVPPTPDNRQSSISNRQLAVCRAFVEAMGMLGNYYHRQYNEGNRAVIAVLKPEEPNLVHARHLARTHGWWTRVISTMQGLRSLHSHTGRRAEWRRLVEEIIPDFVDPQTCGPFPGREDDWALVTQYRVWLAEEAREWAEGERLQRLCVEWTRRRAIPALKLDANGLDDTQRNAIRTLAVALNLLADLQRKRQRAECVATYEEALPLYEHIDDRPTAAITAFNLGHAYMEIPSVRDFGRAEEWYQRSLELTDERDRVGRAQSLGQLGLVAFERFKEARANNHPDAEVLDYLNASLQSYLQALHLLPPDAVDDLAVTHNQLGLIYNNAGDVDRALPHYRECIRYYEASGNLHGAGQTRFNVAVALSGARRLVDAREYALAALRNFETFGGAAAEEIHKAQQLLAQIEQAIAERGGG